MFDEKVEKIRVAMSCNSCVAKYSIPGVEQPMNNDNVYEIKISPATTIPLACFETSCVSKEE